MISCTCTIGRWAASCHLTAPPLVHQHVEHATDAHNCLHSFKQLQHATFCCKTVGCSCAPRLQCTLGINTSHCRSSSRASQGRRQTHKCVRSVSVRVTCTQSGSPRTQATPLRTRGECVLYAYRKMHLRKMSCGVSQPLLPSRQAIDACCCGVHWWCSTYEAYHCLYCTITRSNSFSSSICVAPCL